MQKYRVIVTWEAVYDIAEIADYVIFYIIRESEKEIHVLRVLREERDWESILTQQHDYT